MYWTAIQYAANADIRPRTARDRMERWYREKGRVRVILETLPASGGAPPRTRYLLDVASWRAATGIREAA